MRKTEYNQLLDMLTVLFEAVNTLISMQNPQAEEELQENIQKYLAVMISYTEQTGKEQQELVRALKQLKISLKEPCQEELQEKWNSVNDEFEKLAYEPVGEKLLSAETDFLRYIDLLIQAQEENLCIFITASDTPCGSCNFTAELGQKLCSMGLRYNLYDKFRCSYAAIIKGKEDILEELSDSHTVSLCCEIAGEKISADSVGFGKPGKVHKSRICIGETIEQKAFGRGLTFVVYDPVSKKVLDKVGFDTYLENFPANRDNACDYFLPFQQQHPDVAFLSYERPEMPEKGLSDYEKIIFKNNLTMYALKEYPELAYKCLGYVQDPEGIAEILTQPALYRGLDGARHYVDYAGRYVNCRNGQRVTTGQPENFRRTIYIVGGCINAGVCVRDEGTFASRLQDLLNRYVPQEQFIVENYASGSDGLNEKEEVLATLKTLPLQAGDIVIGAGGITCPYRPEFDVRPCPYGEVFTDGAHLAEGGHQLVADSIFQTLQEHDFFRTAAPVKEEAAAAKRETPEKQDLQEALPELKKYQDKIHAIWEKEFERSDDVGAIVMNCNPFTLGHRYLIEEAAKKCEYLLVFVVEEDRSFFPFRDRIELVRKGTADLKNVYVLESGQFIISAMTFIGYFNKQELQNRVVDSTRDVTVFAKEIAPAAHIRIRFAGTEPFDKVTRQYNNNMKRILPYNGIAFEEIERKKADGKEISATTVRRLLKQHQWEEIKKLVPETTLKYLKENYG